MRISLISLLTLFLFTSSLWAQTELTTPKQYEIAEITVSGIKFLQPSPIIKLSGLKVGNKVTVPGPDISSSIDKLWNQGLFSSVQVYATKIVEDKIYIVIELTERPRLNNLIIKGVRNGEVDNIKDMIKIGKGTQVTDNLIQLAKKAIIKEYNEKGFYNISVNVINKPDTTQNSNLCNLTFDIDKGTRIKVEKITFTGNQDITSARLRRNLKDTKQKTWYHIFKKSKYIPEKFVDDKKEFIKKFKGEGYRDFEILKDTVYLNKDSLLNLDISVKEGVKYYFRNISFLGNTKYNSELLLKVLGIKKGEEYSEERLSDKIFGLDGMSSLYLDNGYLFFNAEPVEKNIENDSIDVEIRIFEGKQATINRIIFTGNTKTKDKVIEREIRTLPGDLFSRADIIRTQRELAQMGYFDPAKMNIEPKPNTEDGTVDIVYTLEEKSNDQIELSGGWSGKYVVLSSKLHLNNLSLQDLFNKPEWPPFGDGQSLVLDVTVNPQYYELESITFNEPWFGGKKPNTLSSSVFHSLRLGTNNGKWRTDGATLGVGRRLKWPDDYFTLYNGLSYQQYKLDNYAMPSVITLPAYLKSNNLSFSTTFSRNCIDQPTYPTRGSSFVLGLEITPPYSYFKTYTDPDALSAQQKYNWVEYHKWTFKSDYYIDIVDKLVLQSRIQFGLLGYFTKAFRSPFEGFDVGGDGLSNINLYGIQPVPLRGYAASSITPSTGGNIYDKLSLELRYPITTGQTATIYALLFAEGGNAWTNYKEFNPYDVKRSAGMGVRIFLPMMGLIGFDYGYGFDEIPGKPNANKWQPSFVLGQQL